MKLPNGYGSVKKLSGKRRNPWIVSKTKEWVLNKDTGKEVQKKIIIGYYPTRSAAMQALAIYNENPYDLESAKLTFNDVYEKWSSEKYPTISHSNVNGYSAAYKLCDSLYDMKFIEIKLTHLQKVVDTSGKNYPTLRKLKVLLSQLYDFATIHEVISKEHNMVEYLNIKKAGNPNSIDRTPFSSNEINDLWKNVHTNEYLEIILMLIYSGVRISEFLDLKKEDVHLGEQWFYIRKSKTESGIRSVPIADKVLCFYQSWLNKYPESDYLLNTPNGEHFQYRNYKDSYWTQILEPLDLQHHKPHDTRHTCVSLLATAKVDATTIKKIVGHSGAQSLTERVYTHLDIQVLLDAINLI